MTEILLGILLFLIWSTFIAPNCGGSRWTASPKVTQAVNRWHQLAEGDPIIVQRAIEKAVIEADTNGLDGVSVTLIEKHIMELVAENKKPDGDRFQ